MKTRFTVVLACSASLGILAGCTSDVTYTATLPDASLLDRVAEAAQVDVLELKAAVYARVAQGGLTSLVGVTDPTDFPILACIADSLHDGTLDLRDVTSFAQQFGTTCSEVAEAAKNDPAVDDDINCPNLFRDENDAIDMEDLAIFILLYQEHPNFSTDLCHNPGAGDEDGLPPYTEGIAWVNLSPLTSTTTAGVNDYTYYMNLIDPPGSDSVCGNGILEAGESCEIGNLNGGACADFGFSDGELSCSIFCTYDASRCSGGSGVQVTNVSGTLSEGNSITIQGVSFGVQGPQIEVFDDFERGTNGDPIMTGSGSAQVGMWDSTQHVTYINTNTRGRLSSRHDHTFDYVNPITAWFPGTREIYVSWWFLVPAGTNEPGYPWNTAGLGWKQMWITGSSTADDDLVVPSLTAGGSTWLVNGNDPDPSYYKYVSGDMNFHKGSWHHMAVWMKGGFSNDGNFHMWRLSKASGQLDMIVDDNNVNTLKEGGAWERVGVDLWGSDTPNCYPQYDDVYVAVGANARARVEIGNRSSYYENTEIAILTPTSWSDTSITATARLGAFRPGDQAYLFVVDGNGRISSTGFPVTIGE